MKATKMRIFSELFKYYLAYSNQAAIHGLSIIVEKSRAWYERSVKSILYFISHITNLKIMMVISFFQKSH